MKKTLLLFLCASLSIQFAKSQVASIPGKPITEIFTDFHYIPGDTSRTTGFGINRAYLGYNFLPQGNFSGTVILNIGNPSELSENEKHRRYAFFREASLSWKKDNLSVSFGITSTRSTIFQQMFLGKRYIADNFESINGYTIVADLGIAVDYKINDIIKVDFCLLNGEGYSELQMNDGLKTSFGINITPFEKGVIRLYGDFNRLPEMWQNTAICFIGYKDEGLTFGAEAAYKTKLDRVTGHDAWGFSATCAKSILRNTEVFARYDYTTSMTDPGEVLNWNYRMDGQFGVFGFQYTFNSYAQIAVDYQGTIPYNPSCANSNAIFVNAHFKF
jgi:hypothetical protein